MKRQKKWPRNPDLEYMLKSDEELHAKPLEPKRPISTNITRRTWDQIHFLRYYGFGKMNEVIEKAMEDYYYKLLPTVVQGQEDDPPKVIALERCER